ncbi:hypothetical protein GCM10020216_078510 [Nonomuraea helvata]
MTPSGRPPRCVGAGVSRSRLQNPAVEGGSGSETPGWETGRVNGDKQPSGGKTLGLILLAMLVILAVIVALAVWASRTG